MMLNDYYLLQEIQSIEDLESEEVTIITNHNLVALKGYNCTGKAVIALT